MSELSINLWVQFLIHLSIDLIGVFAPFLKVQANLKAEELKVKSMFDAGKLARIDMSRAETEGKFEKIELLDEYLPLVMNYGYIMFFSVAFPLGPLIYWLYNILVLKANSYKIINFSKRPMPEQSGGIGIWSDVLKFLSFIGIITNTALLVFTENAFNFRSYDRLWIFIIIEHSLLLIMIFTLKYYPTATEFMKNLEKRQEILKRRFYSLNLKQSYAKDSYEPRYALDHTINFKDCFDN